MEQYIASEGGIDGDIEYFRLVFVGSESISSTSLSSAMDCNTFALENIFLRDEISKQGYLKELRIVSISEERNSPIA